MADSNESLEQLFLMERIANRLPNAGDEEEDATEEAGLGQALATRTPGPNMRRGDVSPLRLGVGVGAGTKETGLGVGLGGLEKDCLGFGGWSGSN